MTKLRWTFAAVLCTLLAACGGKVVVDVGGAGGTNTGGAGPGPNTSGPGQGGGSSSCLAPPDPATLMWCGGTGSGPPPTCMVSYCDIQGNRYEADCEPTTCLCKLNDETVCTCALNGPGDICGGTPHCCPFESADGL
jgi:hypothetical protein